MTKIKVVCCLLILIIATLGCVAPEYRETQPTETTDRFSVVYEKNLGTAQSGWIRVLHDNELNVTIYQTADGYGYQGVAAIPDKDL